VAAAVKMVELKGTRLGGFVGHLLDKFVRGKRMLDQDPRPPCGKGFMERF